MRLVEADGKALLNGMGIVVPSQTTTAPCYVKAQVLKGGRGKAGLVRRVEKTEDIESVKQEISAMLGGIHTAGFLI